jgi:YD repeat-containing protein
LKGFLFLVLIAAVFPWRNSQAHFTGGGWSTATNLYTARGELWKATDALGVTEFTHDDNGNLRYRKNRRNRTWEFPYDDAGQVRSIRELDADERVIALFNYPQCWNDGQPAKEFSVPALPLGAIVHAAFMTTTPRTVCDVGRPTR